MNLIDVDYADQFLREVPLKGASPDMLELHIVACRLLDQLLHERAQARKKPNPPALPSGAR